MKKIIFTTVILLFTGIFFNATAWNTLNSGTTISLTSVYFTDVNTGYVVGNYGLILKTTDGGATWNQQYSDSAVTLNSVYFPDANTGFAVGWNGTILKTINGGTNWTIQTSGTNNPLYSVYFSDVNIGYAVGYLGTIVKTIDGGTTWTTLSSGATTRLLAIHFLNNTMGFIVGTGGVILKTVDAGLTWTQVISGTTSNLYTIFFVDNNTGFIGGLSGAFLKTINGGTSWNSITITPSQNIYSLFFTDSLTGYAAAGSIMKTTDGGSSWTKQATNNDNSSLSVFFVNDSIGYAVGGGTILKTYIGGGYAGSDFLSVNNINALFHSNGSLFFDSPNGGAEFEVPNGSGKATIFAGGLWIGGIDNSGILHLACEKYEQNGVEYFSGPIMDSIYYLQEQEKWNRMWKVSRSEIEYHITHWSNTGYVMPSSIAEWPGNGDPSKGQSLYMAPFYDNNNDGIYNPHQGDYPLIKGDEALFFIFNDEMKEHTEVNGNRLGIEIHAMAYAFNCPEDSAFWNTMFLNYEIINRSQNTYDSTYIGTFMDLDIGDATDDYVGCDVKRGSFYAYNGDSIDGNGMGNSYGANPPAQSVTILGGPFMNADGSDYGSSGIANGCDESVNGLNFNDGIIDNERLGMTKFLYFFPTIVGDPQNATGVYNFLKGKWSDGTPVTYGGTAFGGTIPTSFVFPNNTDSCGWGTSGVPQGLPYWTEQQANNTPGDRRGVASVGPFTMLSGSINQLDLAFVFGRDFTNPAPEAAITVMQQRIDSIRHGFINNITPCGPFNIGVKENKTNIAVLNIYPNPASSYFNIDLQNNFENKTARVYTMDGVLVKQVNFSNERGQVEVNGLSSGLYIVEIKTSKEIYKRKIMVVR